MLEQADVTKASEVNRSHARQWICLYWNHRQSKVDWVHYCK